MHSSGGGPRPHATPYRMGFKLQAVWDKATQLQKNGQTMKQCTLGESPRQPCLIEGTNVNLCSRDLEGPSSRIEADLSAIVAMAKTGGPRRPRKRIRRAPHLTSLTHKAPPRATPRHMHFSVPL